VAEIIPPTARSAFVRHLATLPSGGDGALVITERIGVGIATVMAQARKADALSERLAARFGVTPPTGPGCAAKGGVTLVSSGPGVWLAMQDAADAGFASELGEELTGLASVSDQSGGYALLRISGARVRELLQRGASIDLHPDAFGPGSAAATVIAHIGVIFWQVDTDGYDIALFRSFASSFWHWLETTVEMLGVTPARAA